MSVIISSWIRLRMRNVSDKSCRKPPQKTTHLCSITFSKNRAVYEIMWKNTAGPDGQWIRMLYGEGVLQFACRVSKARTQTHTHNIQNLLLLHGSNHSANAPQSYVIRTLPCCIYHWRSNISFFPLYLIALFSFFTWRYFHVVNWLYFFPSVFRYCCRGRPRHSIVRSGIHSPTTTASSGASVFNYTQLHETKEEDLHLWNSQYPTWQGLYFFNVCVLARMEWS